MWESILLVVGFADPGCARGSDSAQRQSVLRYCDAGVRECDAVAGPASVLIEAFEDRFGSTPDVFRAPGRVNLIGEHTDYNLGFVLPIAIDLACYAASAPNRDGCCACIR